MIVEYLAKRQCSDLKTERGLQPASTHKLSWAMKRHECRAPQARRLLAKHHAGAAICLCLLFFGLAGSAAFAVTPKQKSLDEWRELTSPASPAPQVFVKGDDIRFYFRNGTNVLEFFADWSRHRIPTDSYKVNSALLRWQQNLSRPPELGRHGWREATVIAGPEWRRLTTNLLEVLTPKSPDHGAYYQAFLADRVLYRDSNGVARFALLGEQPGSVIIDHSFSVEETLEVLSRRMEERLVKNHPGDSLFLIMAPNASRFTEPLLLDRQQRRCVWLSPEVLYDTTERGSAFTYSARGLAGLVFESHGLALVKNPFSSATRLANLAVQTAIKVLHFPLPKPTPDVPPLVHTNGMDLAAWDQWLDDYTGTHREDGAINLLIDGDQFFPRLQQAIAQATNHINMNLYIFDRDDVAVAVADQLKQRSTNNVRVHLIVDQMGSLSAGVVPPATPMPEDFVMPASIVSYLRSGSRVRVHQFLNPWFTTDHQKIYLVDGTHAWVGGMNVGREYRYEWHDLMFELNGPVVASLEREFRRDWAHESLLGDFAYAAALVTPPKKSAPAAGTNQWIKLRRLPTRTIAKPFATAVRGALRRAQSYIYVENPYLFDKGVVTELVEARERGVDVRVVLPRVNDFKAGGRSNLVIANYLHQQGVRVYFYPGMTHVKALLVDGWACLGSGNMTHLSLEVAQEQNIATSDPIFAEHLAHDLFEQDFARSYELTQPISVDWVDSMADTVLEDF
jgi:phosphatidylserine/phosphatidylglycerophosphate/cardiolipin synthase-like enzyme